MSQKLKKQVQEFYFRHKRLIITLSFIIAVTLILVVALRSQRHFDRRSIRQIEISITSLGNLAPIAVIGLICLSVAIPPLPLPVPLIEVASGLVFGFGNGFILSWFAQAISSILG